MNHKPINSIEYYRYLEQDERVLAALATSDQIRRAHLIFADQYRDLARTVASIRAEPRKVSVPRRRAVHRRMDRPSGSLERAGTDTQPHCTPCCFSKSGATLFRPQLCGINAPMESAKLAAIITFPLSATMRKKKRRGNLSHG
jgi:hypothetical protein